MNRAVILIGNQDVGENFLAGVSQDLYHYSRFFKSENGGAWENDELFISTNCTVSDLEISIRNLIKRRTEYFLIVFSGHGFEMDGEAYLELRPNEELPLRILQEWLKPVKSLIITDSCREEIHRRCDYGYARIAYNACIFQSGERIPRRRYREAYNSMIMSLEPGHCTVITAAGHDECVNETSSGGVYSNALMKQSISLAHRDMTCVYDIKEIHERVAREIIHLSNRHQFPQFYSTSDSHFPPFVVTL